MINKLANDIARAAQHKLVMINSEIEKQSEWQKQADIMETLRALSSQAGEGLKNFGAQAGESLRNWGAKAKDGLSIAGAKTKSGLSSAGAKAKQEIGAAVDQANAFKQSIENVPVMKDRLTNSISQTDAGLGKLRDALSKGSANDTLAYIQALTNKGGAGAEANSINEALLNYANKQKSNRELSGILQELQGSTSGINDNLSQLINGLENKGYALGAGGALAGGLGGLGLGSLRGSGSSQSDNETAKKSKKSKKMACLKKILQKHEKQAGLLDSLKGLGNSIKGNAENYINSMSNAGKVEQQLRNALQSGAGEVDNIANLAKKTKLTSALGSLTGALTANPLPYTIDKHVTQEQLANILNSSKTLKDTLGASGDTLTNLIQGLKNRGTALGAAGLGAGALGGLGAGYLMGNDD